MSGKLIFECHADLHKLSVLPHTIISFLIVTQFDGMIVRATVCKNLYSKWYKVGEDHVSQEQNPMIESSILQGHSERTR